MTIAEKVAYLKGVADGAELTKADTKESKLILGILDVLEEIGYAIEDLEENDELLAEGLDAVSEDLEDVEELLFPDEEDDGCDCGDGCTCGEDFFEVECPNCSEDLVIDGDILEDGKVQCPSCGDTFAFEFDECDDDEEEEDPDQLKI